MFCNSNLSAPLPVRNRLVLPLILFGTGVGNTSFDLKESGLVQVWYIQIINVAHGEVELDAVGAVYFKKPPRFAPNGMVPISGSFYPQWEWSFWFDEESEN